MNLEVSGLDGINADGTPGYAWRRFVLAAGLTAGECPECLALVDDTVMEDHLQRAHGVVITREM